MTPHTALLVSLGLIAAALGITLSSLQRRIITKREQRKARDELIRRANQTNLTHIALRPKYEPYDPLTPPTDRIPYYQRQQGRPKRRV